MGVPKFFWSVSERYPCLSELVTEFKISDFDNLYLDMNGIIHACSHPNDFDPHFSIDEENIFASIFHYIEVLFNIIKPKKLFFMAVDGVAPRAKMNQQRARRFRSAKEAEMKEKEALRKGDKPIAKERFDSNCITPGTVFMDHLHSQLKYFLTSKISTDPLWQDCKIILSGHQTPGEGEHKIMDYIRYLKTQPDYDENTRHCLYGLDADLIMLGMCTHEPHFSLLREKVKFTKQQNKRILSPDETDFYLLHLSLLREYLDLEFQELKQTLPFQYDLENIIDDWVLMGFLVGNDFIPHLPDLHLNKDAFLILYKAYKEVLPTLDGYLNENGYLNLPRFQKFLERMAEHDLIMFEDTYANLTFLEEKTGKNVFEMPNGDVSKASELDELIKATDELLEISDEDSPGEEPEENGTFMWEFYQHKKNYYTNKLDYSKVTPEVLKSQAEGYVRAIQWILHYYYQGCQSWSWFYPHHYAPYVSDIKDFEDLKLEFEMGKPFQPFEQLLAVLPAASKNLLPEVYHHLMSSPDSPIIDFYPTDFRTDLNGKQQDWEAVVLIPFIDEKRLLEAMAPYNEQLTPEEKRRNQHGPMHVYSYTKEDLGVYNSVKYFPNIPSNHALVKDVSREEITVDKCFLKYGLRPGVLLDVLYPGFPTLKHVPHTARLKSAKVKVFERPSKNPSMILKIKEREFPPLSVLANNMLGKTVYVNWPHLVESRAVAVSDKKARYYLTNDGKIEYEVFDKQKQIQWRGAGEDIRRRYSGNLGIELGEIEVVIHVLLVDGRKHSFGPMGKVTIENIWSSNSTAAALQVVVHNISVKDFRTRVYNHLRDAFPVGSVVFMLGHPHFGSMGRVLDNSGCSENVRLKVELETTSDPSLQNIILKPESKVVYFPYKVAALKVGISPRLLSRITGSLLVSMTNDLDLGNSGSKINIGLGLKFFNKTEEIPGYTKLENDSWMYSQKVIDIVAAYIEKFSRVIDFLSANQEKNIFYVHEIFPGPDGVTEMKEMVEWIKQQEYKKVERVKSGTIVLEPEIISEIEKVVERTPKMIIKRQMQIKPTLLYKNDLVFGKVAPVKLAKHNLLDRVISIRSSYTVPTGLRGFIIGIHPAPIEADYMYDILFDSPFVGGMKLNCSTEKGFRMCKASFLNVSDAYRQSQRPALGPGSLGNLCPRPSQGEPKTSAFAQWTHRSPKLVENEDVNEFDKIWSDLQAAKPQEDALKKILKIEKREKQEIEDPVKSFFERVTKATSESPGAPEKVVENNQPKNKYYLQLFSYYQRQGLGQPEFRYHQMGEKVMAEVLFKDGKVYSGLPCDDKGSACESAALQALGALGLIPIKNETLLQKERERSRTIENQMKLLNPLVNPNSKGSNQSRTPQKNHCPGAEMPPLLPDPPLQWVGLSRNAVNQGFHTHPQRENVRRRTDGQEKPQNYQNPSCKKQSASALEFVPLQAITGKRNYGKIATIPSSKQSKETQKKTQVVAMTINNVGTSTPAPKPKRKPKIAAKLNLDPNLY